ncbi:MAG: hypothetical protein AB1391_03840 [Candidatus Micrarchaeota archaeon]
MNALDINQIGIRFSHNYNSKPALKKLTVLFDTINLMREITHINRLCAKDKPKIVNITNIPNEHGESYDIRYDIFHIQIVFNVIKALTGTKSADGGLPNVIPFDNGNILYKSSLICSLIFEYAEYTSLKDNSSADQDQLIAKQEINIPLSILYHRGDRLKIESLLPDSDNKSLSSRVPFIYLERILALKEMQQKIEKD